MKYDPNYKMPDDYEVEYYEGYEEAAQQEDGPEPYDFITFEQDYYIHRSKDGHL